MSLAEKYTRRTRKEWGKSRRRRRRRRYSCSIFIKIPVLIINNEYYNDRIYYL